MMNAIKPMVVLLALTLAASMFIAGCEKAEPPAAEPSPGGQTQIAQKTCPVMGGAIDPNIYVDHEGRRVYFCCPACLDKFKKDPEKHLKKLDEQLQAPAKEPDAPPSW
ncbi:MAG: YHS domain-containing protein [Phycisphaerae bacterium]